MLTAHTILITANHLRLARHIKGLNILRFQYPSFPSGPNVTLDFASHIAAPATSSENSPLQV